MKRIKMVLALAAAMAMMLVVSVAPAMAADNNHNNDNFRFDRFNDFNDGFFFNPFFDRFDNRFFDNGFNNNGISQQNEQDVQSGDASQSIDVTGGGDNSNQCAGVQGVVNTGNATSNTGVLQYRNEDAEVEVDDSGNFEISPSQTTTCDQRVNQAASATG